MTWSITYPTVGAMFQVTLVTTLPGASSFWSLMLPTATRSFSGGRLDDAEALREEHVGAGADLRQGRLLGGGGVEPAVEEGDLDVDIRVRRLGAGDEGVDDAVHLRHGVAAHDAEHVRLRHATGDHPGQVGGLMDPVVEDAEVRLRRTAAGAEDEGDVGVIGSHRADRLLVAEGVAEDDVRGVLLGGFAQHALHVAGVADVIGEGVVDAAGVGLGLEGGVDHAVPWLLDLGGEGTEDLRGRRRPRRPRLAYRSRRTRSARAGRPWRARRGRRCLRWANG